MVSARKVSDATGLKDNDYKRFSRSGLSECMLGRAAIVVEGVTELHAMPIIARRMEENDPNLQPLTSLAWRSSTPTASRTCQVR